MARRSPAKKEKEDSGEGGTVLDAHFNLLTESLNKQFGENSAISLDSADTLSRIDFWVTSRSIAVDKVLAGGRAFPCSLVPFGRQMEISGPPGAGKTTLCAQIAAETQKQGGLVIVTDTEERIDHAYWSALGVDNSKVINLRAETLEEVFEKQYFAIKTMREKAPNRMVLMIWDSVGGTSSGAVLDEKEDNKTTFMERAAKQMGREAKIIGNGVKGLSGYIAKSKVCYLYTNHIYSKIGVTYGDPNETYGGQKLKFLATVRLQLKPGAAIKEKDAFGNVESPGKWVTVKALKNSMSPMLMEKSAVVMGGVGFSNQYLVWDVAKKNKLISGAGAWSTWKTPKGEDVKFQGWSGFQEKVVTHSEYADLESMVIEAY